MRRPSPVLSLQAKFEAEREAKKKKNKPVDEDIEASNFPFFSAYLHRVLFTVLRSPLPAYQHSVSASRMRCFLCAIAMGCADVSLVCSFSPAGSAG